MAARNLGRDNRITDLERCHFAERNATRPG